MNQYSTLDTAFDLFDNKTNLTGCGEVRIVGSGEFVCLRGEHNDDLHYLVKA